MKKSIILFILLAGMIFMTIWTLKSPIDTTVYYSNYCPKEQSDILLSGQSIDLTPDYTAIDDVVPLSEQLQIPMSTTTVTYDQGITNIDIIKPVSYTHQNIDDQNYGIIGIPFTYGFSKSHSDNQSQVTSLTGIATLITNVDNSVKENCHPIQPPKVPVGDGLGILTILLAIYTSFKVKTYEKEVV